ncbi:MAG: hypothetical protein ACAH83_17420 [Alphaproteobacteria bacterium]
MASDEYEALPMVEKVIRELNSSYEGSGASKEVQGVVFVEFVPNPAHETIGRISVFSHQTSPWGDSDNTRRLFDVTYEDVKILAETAPEFRFSFIKMSEEMAKQAETDTVLREEWRRAGMPVAQPVTVYKPLRLKHSP